MSGTAAETLILVNLPTSLSLLRGKLSPTYQPFIIANKASQEAGAKAFHAFIYGEEEVSYLSRPYPEQSRQMIADRLVGLKDPEREWATHWLLERDITVFLHSELF